MKTAFLSLALLLTLCAAPSPASDYWRKLECDWQRDRPAIEADIETSNALLRYRCDAQLFAATRHRFRHIDQESLASYNRGIFPAVMPSRPEAAAAVIRAAPPVGDCGSR